MVTQYANPPSTEPAKNVFTGEDAWLLFAKVSFGKWALVVRILNLNNCFSGERKPTFQKDWSLEPSCQRSSRRKLSCFWRVHKLWRFRLWLIRLRGRATPSHSRQASYSGRPRWQANTARAYTETTTKIGQKPWCQTQGGFLNKCNKIKIIQFLKLSKPGKKPACAVPDELMMCEQGFLELLSVKTIGDDHELFGKFIDVLKEAPDAVFPTPKEAV